MNTPQLLTHYETCDRKGFYSLSFEQERLPASPMVAEAMRVALEATEQREYGEIAGDAVMQLAADRGLDTESSRIYQSACHHACLADILTSAVRKPDEKPWKTPPPVHNWTSGAYVAPDGKSLRRIVLVTHWTDDRKYSECRSWYTAGECATYNLPMQIIVAVIGQQRDGLRYSPWTTGFLHPANHVLRFRKKQRTVSEIFNERWEKIHREDHAEISRGKWLQSMLTDDVLREVLFRIDVPIPGNRQQILDMAERKLERLHALTETPEPNLSSCDWPVPCPFRECCHSIPERSPGRGFIRINTK